MVTRASKQRSRSPDFDNRCGLRSPTARALSVRGLLQSVTAAVDSRCVCACVCVWGGAGRASIPETRQTASMPGHSRSGRRRVGGQGVTWLAGLVCCPAAGVIVRGD
ncbi:hypothetical protein RRG08_056191 [Elysia crispata]|uniref:Uncharacterized protein n=1 Tax=Elysia crispata TaxID=231223 RepID=A0AAE0Z2P7_9GAST|nr:hypothetical protein RRG08_056191 [Elysia crispata]